MTKKYIEVGEEFQFGLVRLKCEKADDEDACKGCFFNEYNYNTCMLLDNFLGSCGRKRRDDNNNVIFIKID